MTLKSLRHLLILKKNATSILSLRQTTAKGTTTELNEVVQLHEGKIRKLNLSDPLPIDAQNARAEISLVTPKQTTQEIPARLRNLTAAEIHDMLLRFPFSKWTLSTLNAASSTLTKLSLEMKVEGDLTWKTFSRCLSLPILKDFSLGRGCLFADIELFLMNHPSIQDLHLYGVQLPPSLETVPRPTFQNLVKFNGHPFYVVWLLKRVKQRETALPNLECLRISLDTYSSRLNYTFFEPALEAVAESRKTFALALTFQYRIGIVDWLESHVHKGGGHEGSIVSRLSNIPTLVVGGSYFSPNMMAIIPDWIQLFPNLRQLKFECKGPISTRQLTDTKFITTIAILCPDLEMIEVNEVHIFDLWQVRLANLGGELSFRRASD